jgi:hypothetical protein
MCQISNAAGFVHPQDLAHAVSSAQQLLMWPMHAVTAGNGNVSTDVDATELARVAAQDGESHIAGGTQQIAALAAAQLPAPRYPAVPPAVPHFARHHDSGQRWLGMRLTEGAPGASEPAQLQHKPGDVANAGDHNASSIAQLLDALERHNSSQVCCM